MRLGTTRVLSICPETWVQLESTENRLLDFRLIKHPDTEIYLSVLSSRDDNDFVTPNINRWRQQMGQLPLTQEQVAELPTVMMFGQPARRVTIDGSFKGFGSPQPKAGYRMVGAILQIPQFTFFVKMTGPQHVVAQEEPNFDEFVSTLKFR